MQSRDEGGNRDIVSSMQLAPAVPHSRPQTSGGRDPNTTTDVIKLAEFEDTYDDPDHAIPSLTHIEVYGIRKKGGADLVIIIAKPLGADEYSLTRLLDKIETYLEFIGGDEFRREAGEPSPENVMIAVYIHPDSSPEAFKLLESSVAWVKDNGATLTIKALDDES